jgi:hypothetical protein
VKALIISNALDTNGQNARYAKASEKWGTSKGVLKALALGYYDPAGVVGRYAAAAEKFGFLRIRSVHRSEHIYQQMPADIIWTRRNRQEIIDLAEDADILHFNNSMVAARHLRLPRDKPTILHHHGSLFRNNPMFSLHEAKNYRATQCVSTVDLMHAAPHLLHWAPTAYDIDWLEEYGRTHREDRGATVRVVQCPTDGSESPYKSTPALEAAVRKLQAEGLDIELVVVRDKPWLEAMAIKATADIYFDQVKLGYGCNAIEAWGMGIPVIAGADEWTLAKMREVFGTKTLPFYSTTEGSIAEALVDLATSKAKRTTYAKRGMAHIRKFHDELPALTTLAGLYRRAIEHEGEEAKAVVVPPATFIAKVPQIQLGGKRITFSVGPYTTDNPQLATALRARAMRYPREGIEEVG